MHLAESVSLIVDAPTRIVYLSLVLVCVASGS